MADPHSHSDSRLRKILDYSGASLGFICTIHCLITPLAIGALPIAGLSVLWTEEGESALLLGLLFFAVLSGGIAVWRTRAWKIAGGFVLSLTFLFSAHLMIDHHRDQSIHLALSLLGGLGLISCHLWSLRRQRDRACCQPEGIHS